MPHAAEIVDFKSDWIAASDAGRWARERYVRQLTNYRDAVAERFRIDPKDIRLRVLLVTPSSGEPVAVDLD
jgi:ATP-dependent exoDNAse (exonuclease V) beta subunit